MIFDLSGFKRASGLTGGKNSSVFSNAWIDFKEIREYREGDESKRVDWKSSARTGKLRVREYEADRDMPVWILSDIGATMGFGSEWSTKSDVSALIVGTLGLSAIFHGNRFGFATFSSEISEILAPTKSRAVISLAEKASRNLKTQLIASNPDKAISQVLSKFRERSVMFLITDGPFEINSATKYAARHGHLFVILVRDRREDSLDFGSDIRLASIDQQSGWFSKYFSRKEDKISSEHLLSDFQSLLQKVGIASCKVYAGEDPYDPIRSMLLGRI